MKIAVVHSFYSSSAPSGENVVVDLQMEALRSAGHEVRLVGRRTDDVMSGPLSELRAALTVATGHGPTPMQQLNDFRPDVVHVHNLFPNFGTSWLGDLRAPVVATLHNYRPLCSAGTLWRDGHYCNECVVRGSQRAVVHACYRGSAIATLPLAVATRGRGRVNAVLARAQALIALAPGTASEYIEARPDLEGRIHIVPNFAPDRGVGAVPSLRDPWVYVGRLSEEKGIDRLIDHWPADEPLVVVGTGPLEEQLRTAAESKPIRFTGVVSSAEVHRTIVSGKALIFPSLWREPAPAMSYVEALAAGRPTLAVGSNAVVDDVERARSGVAIEDFSTLRWGMSRLVDGLDRTASAARQRFCEMFSEQAWLTRILQVYEHAIAAYHQENP